jgi:hypothetical protein
MTRGARRGDGAVVRQQGGHVVCPPETVFVVRLYLLGFNRLILV